eukprot:6567082-Prymnesium_polylepis.1
MQAWPFGWGRLTPFETFRSTFAFLLDVTVNMGGDFSCVAEFQSKTQAIAGMALLMFFSRVT